MIGKFRRQHCLFNISVELTTAEREIHTCAVTAFTAGNGMLNVIGWIGTDEVSYTNLFSRIQTDMILLLPQLVFQDIRFRWLYRLPGFFLVEFDDLLFAVVMLFLIVTGILCQGNSFVGIIQFTGELDMNSRVAVDLTLLEELVNGMTHLEEGAHSHRIAEGIIAW